MSRKKEQANLIRKLGAFFAPIEHLVANPDLYDDQTRARVFARAFVERDELANSVSRFVEGEPGHRYLIQNSKFHAALNCFVGTVLHNNDTSSLQDALEKCTPLMQEAILEVPVEGVSGILDARSPFTAYCKLKDICCATLQKLIWTDRYFDASVFHRYLREVRAAAGVTLVTLDPTKLTSAKDKARHAEFTDVSRLYAAERGPHSYRLVAHPDFHDRWLRCDAQLYALGGSVKDAGQKSDFSIGSIDPTAGNLGKVDELVCTGRELFGPAQTTHL
jgi:hypothetical protein